MKISIVVPAFNEQKLITETLRQIKNAMAAFSESGWTAELIVCDNNSTDATPELARAEDAQVVFEPINQIARARNRGAQAAGGDWLIFIDADTHPSRELFRDVVEAIQSDRCIGGGSTVAVDEPLLFTRVLLGGWNLLSRVRRWAAGSFIFCEAQAFQAVGGFSNELFVAEELEFSKALNRLAREQGKKFIILRRHPIVTSARKIHLYSPREHFQFWSRAILKPWKTMRNRDACPTWYDGRR